jgi:Protein of unknown function (DUF664)
VSDVKEELHRKLQASRAGLLSKLDNLSEYDRRRPMTPTGTNLLGLVKHLAGLEYGYLGEPFGRPAPETMSWIEDGSIWQGADMWARPLIRMVAETAQHAGHADIIRELIDGKGGPDQGAFDEATWREYIAQVQAAANTFATGSGAQPRAS